jgi:hypothetical protein
MSVIYGRQNIRIKKQKKFHDLNTWRYLCRRPKTVFPFLRFIVYFLESYHSAANVFGF